MAVVGEFGMQWFGRVAFWAVRRSAFSGSERDELRAIVDGLTAALKARDAASARRDFVEAYRAGRDAHRALRLLQEFAGSMRRSDAA